MKDMKWGKVWLLPNPYLITNKVKEVTFKLIHRIYPHKDYIKYKFKLNIDDNCTFYQSEPESALHLFWLCPFVFGFSHDIYCFISNETGERFELYWRNALYGILHLYTHTLILIILMAKYHIHRSKYMAKKKKKLRSLPFIIK